MTWSAHLTVQDVSAGPAPIDVLAAVNADDVIETTGADGATVSTPALYSNTEGKLLGVEVRFQLDENETALSVGDKIYVSGHFTGQVAKPVGE